MSKFSDPYLSHFSFFGYNKQKYSESEILEGLTQESDVMISYIYKNYFPGIKLMVFRFHSLILDAEDVFQEGLTRAILNIRDQKFKGGSTFNTYLTSICRNICLKELDRAKKIPASDYNPAEYLEPDFDQEELISRIITLKDRMDENCRYIIDLRFGLPTENDQEYLDGSADNNVRFEEIARKLKIEPDNARQRFRRCLEKLKEILLADNVWKEINSLA